MCCVHSLWSLCLCVSWWRCKYCRRFQDTAGIGLWCTRSCSGLHVWAPAPFCLSRSVFFPAWQEAVAAAGNRFGHICPCVMPAFEEYLGHTSFLLCPQVFAVLGELVSAYKFSCLKILLRTICWLSLFWGTSVNKVCDLWEIFSFFSSHCQLVLDWSESFLLPVIKDSGFTSSSSFQT